MKDIIEKFKKDTGHTLEEKDGRLYYSHSIDLGYTEITSLPEGLTVGGYLDLRGTEITRLPEGLIVGGSLDLRGTKITSLPEGLTVGGYLDLRGTEITRLPEELIVGGVLDLEGTKITSLPEGLIVGGSLDLRGTKITSLPEGLIVGGALDLEEVEITSLPKGLIVGEYLYIKGTKIKSLPEGLIVGEFLDIRGTEITSLPKELTVGGDLFLPDTDITDTSNVKKNAPTLYQWRNNQYVKCDGIFNEVISHHGNVYKVKDIGKTKEYYLVGDGNGKWAHGDTIEEARKDLLYKISNRDKSKYEDLTLDSVLSYEEAIECYRVITGACSAGTKGFCENELAKKKDYYSIKEIISLTGGKYGNIEFKKFFS